MVVFFLAAASLGVLAGASQYVAEPDMWPGKVIAYGLGTTFGIFGVVVFFFSLLAIRPALDEAIPGLKSVHIFDDPEEREKRRRSARETR